MIDLWIFIKICNRNIFIRNRQFLTKLLQNLPISAARKVDKKVAKLLLKVAQKVATLKNHFKTSLKPVQTGFLKFKFLDFAFELVPNLY